MNIIKRNFFTALRIGAFHSDELFEPMSAFKWRKLLSMADAHEMGGYIARSLADYDCNGITAATAAMLHNYRQQHVDDPTGIPAGATRQSALQNGLLNSRLENIRDNERHAIDTSVESLELLNLIVWNSAHILKSGISLQGIMALGMMLRQKGDRIDFVKTDRWLGKLQLRRMAQLEGSILVAFFGFDTEEVPFLDRCMREAIALTEHELGQHPGQPSYNWHFRQGRSGFLHNDATSTGRTLRHAYRYMGYAPVESISTLLHNFTRSLAEIEE